MSSETGRQFGWEKVFRLAEEAKNNYELQEVLRSKRSKEELVEFLRIDIGEFGIERFEDDDFVDLEKGFDNLKNLIELTARPYWIGLKFDIDFLDMK